MARPRFTLEQARTFLAVAEREHVTRAAEAIHLSQGAVTQQIQFFERALRLQLFERSGRTVRLTDAGRSLLVACRALLRAAEGLEEAAEGVRELEVGSLHVGASQTAASHYLPGPLAAFMAAHPGVRLQVTPANTALVCTQVAAGMLDCGLVEGEVAEREVLAVDLRQDEVLAVVAAGHKLARAARLPRSRLREHIYLAREEGSGTEALARELLGREYEGVARLELGQLDSVRAAAVAGLGFAVLPRVAIESELGDRRLVALPLAPRRRWIRAVRRRTPGGPALEAFWAVLTASQESATSSSRSSSQ